MSIHIGFVLYKNNLLNLKETKVWKLMTNDIMIIETKWLFRNKLDENSNVI
jgi:hypothetical protein